METVLPGPDEALPPVEPICTAIWRKRLRYFKFLKNSATFPIFWPVPKFCFKKKSHFFSKGWGLFYTNYSYMTVFVRNAAYLTH
jgi:hypothetical protein